MKFVRTKKGIYEFPEGFTEFNWNGKTLLENEEHVVWTGGEILAQSDNLEELIDEFVIDGGEKPYIEKDLNFMIFVIRTLKYEVYGAIWTKGKHGEPNLKTVTKMNEKGNLELL